jgi:hypothetical protein
MPSGNYRNCSRCGASLRETTVPEAAVAPVSAAAPAAPPEPSTATPRRPARAIARVGLRVALAGGSVAEVEVTGKFGAIVRTDGRMLTVPYGTPVVFDGYRVPLVAPQAS